MNNPIVTVHEGVSVVRDDLFKGGTKARFLPTLFDNADEVVYATPAEGGAQTALAHSASALGKRATIFVAKRKNPHPRTLEALSVGGNVIEVSPGYLTVVQARAREYCKQTGAMLAPFGVNLPAAIDRIAEAARMTGLEPDEVWCASGSGVLARGLAKAWPDAQRHVVEVGRTLSAEDVAGAIIHKAGIPFSKALRELPPFPSCPHYDAKAWFKCLELKGDGNVLFWNVTGPAKIC